MICPITHIQFTDPCVAMDGHTYERSAIETWFQTSNLSPVTGLKLVNCRLVPNHALRSIIQEKFPNAELTKIDYNKLKEEEEEEEELTDFDLSREQIDLSREQIDLKLRLNFSSDIVNSIYFGIFEQTFLEPCNLSMKSFWNIKMEIESIYDYSTPKIITCKFLWKKYEQHFLPTRSDFPPIYEPFLNQLSSTLGKSYISKAKGEFNSNFGLLDLREFENNGVGKGVYKLFLGPSTCDGHFYTLDREGNPTTTGIGYFRLVKF